MDRPPSVVRGKHRGEHLGELIPDSQQTPIADRLIVRGCGIREADIEEGFLKIRQMYPSVADINTSIQHEASRCHSRVKQQARVSDRVKARSERNETCVIKAHTVNMFFPGGRRIAG